MFHISQNDGILNGMLTFKPPHNPHKTLFFPAQSMIEWE